MIQALAFLTILVFALASALEARPHSRGLLWLLLAMEMAIGLNGIAHGLAAAFVFRGYAPGLVTGLILNVPFAAYCFLRAKRDAWLGEVALQATIPAGFVLHGPVLLAGLWLATTVRN